MPDVSPTVTTDAAPAQSLPARMIGVIFSPRATYAGVAARPHWFGVLALVVAIGAAAVFTFLSTEVGQNASLDQQVRMMESFGAKVTDQMYDRMESGVERAKYFGAVSQVITLPLAALIISGISLGVFNALLGGDGTFKQVFSIVAHSGVIITLSQLFGLPLAYSRESLSGTTNLGVFVQFLDENSFMARMMGSIDLFIIWWLVSLAIGLGVLYKKKTGPIATSLILIYVTIGVVIAAIKTAVSGA